MTADPAVSDIGEAEAFFTDFLGLDEQDVGLNWITRVVVPSWGEHIQLLPQDASGPENPLLSVKVDDVDEAYTRASSRLRDRSAVSSRRTSRDEDPDYR